MQEEGLFLPDGSLIRDPAGGSYVVEAVLGGGGFGAAYLVRGQDSQHQVFALKEELHPTSSPQARFQLEADLLKRLDHPALPHVYCVFKDEQHHRVYILMDYIPGPTLEALQKSKPESRFPLHKALELMAPIADALMYLHRQTPPIVHRDVKPANIIVSAKRDGVFLVDFGTAKEYIENGTTNLIREVTPGYAALEQYSGGTTPRTDLYGLGATFYTLLTGVIPPDAIRRTLRSGGTDPLVPVSLLVPEIPTKVNEIIARAMAIDSTARFETIEQFWQEMRRQAAPPHGQPTFLDLLDTSPTSPEHHPGESRLLPARKAPSTPAQRKRWGILLLTMILLFSVSGGIGLWLSLRTNRGAPIVISSGPASPTFAILGCRVSPIATLSLGVPLYPRLTPCYSGTIADLLTQQKTAMYLLTIQQNQGTIRGTFQGLGLAGMFDGSVTNDGQLQFTLPVHAGEQSLAFTGTIKIGGDIKGNFQVLDQQGNFIGEFGDWYVAPAP